MMKIKYSDISEGYNLILFDTEFAGLSFRFKDGKKQILFDRPPKDTGADRKQFFGVDFKMDIHVYRRQKVLGTIHYYIVPSNSDLATVYGHIQGVSGERKEYVFSVPKPIPYLLGLFYTSIRAVLERSVK